MKKRFSPRFRKSLLLFGVAHFIVKRLDRERLRIKAFIMVNDGPDRNEANF